MVAIVLIQSAPMLVKVFSPEIYWQLIISPLMIVYAVIGGFSNIDLEGGVAEALADKYWRVISVLTSVSTAYFFNALALHFFFGQSNYVPVTFPCFIFGFFYLIQAIWKTDKYFGFFIPIEGKEVPTG